MDTDEGTFRDAFDFLLRLFEIGVRVFFAIGRRILGKKLATAMERTLLCAIHAARSIFGFPSVDPARWDRWLVRVLPLADRVSVVVAGGMNIVADHPEILAILNQGVALSPSAVKPSVELLAKVAPIVAEPLSILGPEKMITSVWDARSDLAFRALARLIGALVALGLKNPSIFAPRPSG